MVNQSCPPIVTWKDQMEEYLIVTENDDGLPSNAQKRKKSFIIPVGFNLDLERFHCDETKTCQNEWEKKYHEMDRFEVDSSIKPFTNGGYVDIQRPVDHTQGVEVKPVDYSRVKEVNGDNILLHKNENVLFESGGYIHVQIRENMPEEYSRVKKVDSDNTVILQSQHASGDTSSREKGNHYTDPQKARKPNMCTELIEGGYVDTINASSNIK